jgi:NAD(P)-dependent dehydrogenase (short-subunit alcohol dehydrogenase family)
MKTYLITGGTSGVGKAIATGIAKKGAKVVIVGRNESNADIALKEIFDKTGNKDISFLRADLSLIKSVSQLCEKVKLQHAQLNGLVNAAGGLFFDKEVTSEGIDQSFAVNYLSHFALSTGLLELLKKTEDSRIVTVGGNPLFMKNPKLNLNDLQLSKSYGGLKAAGYGMFARIFFGFEMADRLKDTSVSSMIFHPGFVRSNLTNNAPLWLKMVLNLSPSVRNAPDTCESGVYVALKQDAKSTNGRFFNNKNEIIDIRPNFDKLIGEQLWQISESILSASIPL